MISRRNVLTGLGASLLSTPFPVISWADTAPRPLAMPPLLDATKSGTIAVDPHHEADRVHYYCSLQLAQKSGLG